VTLRQLDGSFIRYAQLFPDRPTGRAVVEVASLLEAIKAIASVAERNTPVRLEFAPGQVSLGAGGGAAVHLPGAMIDAASEEPEPVVIAVNPRYLIDGLASLSTPYARLTYPENVRPVVMTGAAWSDVEGDEQFRYLFIPVRSSTNG
jgi:DNA polymerase-3 subunit beta